MRITFLPRFSLGLAILAAPAAFSQAPIFSNRTMVFLQFSKQSSDSPGALSLPGLVTATGVYYSSSQLGTMLPDKQLVITDIVISGRRASLTQYKSGVSISLATSLGTHPNGGFFGYPYTSLSMNFPSASMEATVEQHFSSGMVFTAPNLPFFRFSLADGSRLIPTGIENDFIVYAYGHLVDK